MTALAVDSMQGLFCINMLAATPSCGNPDIAKIAVYMAWLGSNGIIGTATNMKCAKLNKSVVHRSSSPRTALGLKAEGSIWKIHDILPHKLHTSGDPRCISYAFGGGANGESKSASILGDLKTTCKQHLAINWWLETRTSLLSHGMSTNCWRKPTDTPWMHGC